MTEENNAEKFYEGLLDLSNASKSGSGGERQELEIETVLTQGLEDLSEIQDNQLER